MANRWGVNRAIVTGAGSGIGQALAKSLLADGAELIALDLRFSEEAKKILEGCSQAPDQITYVEVNVTDHEAMNSKVAEAVAKLGAPDYAVNCAGITETGNFLQIPQDKFELVININVIGSRNFATAVLPHMGEGGRFVLFASMAGLFGNYAYGAYSTSKFAVVGMADVLRVEYKQVGVSVSVVCPPEVPTPMVEKEQFHPVQRVLKDEGGVVTLEELVPYVLEKTAIQKRFRVIPGARARLMYWASCYLPTRLLHAYLDRKVAAVFKREPNAPKR